MKSSTATPRHARAKGGFTLAEVLAALVFMAIVIPVAVQALRIGARASESALRKDAATRIARQALDEAVVVSSPTGGSQRGSVSENQVNYQWEVRSEAWQVSQLRLLTARVSYAVQGANQEIQLTTLASPSQN